MDMLKYYRDSETGRITLSDKHVINTIYGLVDHDVRILKEQILKVEDEDKREELNEDFEIPTDL